MTEKTMEELMKFDRDYLDDICDKMDAAVFSGDAFMSATNRKVMTLYICRWLKAMPDWEAMDRETTEGS